MDFYRHFLVLDGLCLTQHHRTNFLYRPGDFVITPHADQSRATSIASVSFDERTSFSTQLYFLTGATLAYFDKSVIDEMLKDPDFLAASYQNLQDLYAHIVAYLIGIGASSAYDAVKFILQYCAHNDIGHLTHEQIAKATGHSRTTVTAAMHEIALAEPELLR